MLPRRGGDRREERGDLTQVWGRVNVGGHTCRLRNHVAPRLALLLHCSKRRTSEWSLSLNQLCSSSAKVARLVEQLRQ